MVAITIMLVDNHLLMLDGMKRILEDVADFKVTAAFQDGIAAIEHLKKHKMDIVLMNTQLPGQSGLETCRMITRKYSSTRVIMLTNDSNDFHLQQAIRAGAKGYLSKSIDSQELMEAIYSVYRKGAMVPLFAVPQTLRRATCSYTQEIEPFHALTPKEREILPLIVEGKTTNQVADFLCISPKTVRNHLSHIYKRLGTRDRLQTIIYMSQKIQTSVSLDV